MTQVYGKNQMNRQTIHQLTCVVLLAWVALCGKASPLTDTLTSAIDEVTVTAPRVRRDIIPVQQIEGETLRKLSAYSVADAMRYFAGVQIKDYGGIGGLKTINVRSLGTNHTGVFYDGVQLGNAQNGQIDLGRFSLDNMETLQLYNGQKSTIHQTAKDYSSASAVYMQTRKPIFTEHKRRNINIGMKAGSFDTYNPSLLWEEKLTDNLSAQLSAEYMTTSGKYKFRYAKKNGYDTTEVRKNGDVKALRVETALFGTIKRGEWRTKLYFYDSERGFPGAIVREEPGKFTHQDRQWDTSIFGQASWRKRITDRYSLLLNSKVAYDYLHYISDPRLDVSTMYTDNQYRQTEAYLSASHLYSPTAWMSVSLANDVQYNYLDANLTHFVYPTRWTALTSLATNISAGDFSAQASLLHTYVDDRTQATSGTAGRKNVFTPTAAISWKVPELLFSNTALNIRAFYKRIFRMPTFNDLYYTFIGNKVLKPEYTTQYDLGFTYDITCPHTLLTHIQIQVDGYYNEVKDKIVAIPTSNQFRWTMMNFGLCHIWGADASIKAQWHILGTDITTSATYTYNRAMDHTDRNSEWYGGQLPYIPRNAGSAIITATRGAWSANYSFIYTGERYEASANIPENYSKPWYTSDLSLSRDIKIKYCMLRLSAEVNNLFNQQYEVVQCYPMPGTNFKIKLNIML